MKKLILIILILMGLLYLFSQRYTIQSGRSRLGTFNLVLVDKKSGEAVRVMGD